MAKPATKQSGNGAQAQSLKQIAAQNGAVLDLSQIGGDAPIEDILEEEIKKNKVKSWFKLEDGQDATVRFFGWKNGAKIRVHSSFGVIQRTVCPRLFGLPCEFCNRPDAEQITRTEWVFQVYWYEVGKVVFFNYPENNNSPIGDLLNQQKKLQKMKKPLSLENLDVTLTQIGKDTQRKFSLFLSQPEPFDTALLNGTPIMTREELVLSFVSRVSPALLGLEDEREKKTKKGFSPDIDTDVDTDEEDVTVEALELGELDVFGNKG